MSNNIHTPQKLSGQLQTVSACRPKAEIQSDKIPSEEEPGAAAGFGSEFKQRR